MRKLAIAAVLAASLGSGWLAFQPRVANHFAYALPMKNGLPCRISFLGRHFDNNEQCLGMNGSGRSVWYAKHHHVPSGGACEGTGQLRKVGFLPLHRIGGISTLLGPSHAVLQPHADRSGVPTVLLVEDNGCYRPYELSGGP